MSGDSLTRRQMAVATAAARPQAMRTFLSVAGSRCASRAVMPALICCVRRRA